MDDFNRANGSIGTNWVGEPDEFAIDTQHLEWLDGSNWATTFWGTLQGANQEAYVTLVDIDEQDDSFNLFLKAQSTIGDLIELINVYYSPSAHTLAVKTYDVTNGWVLAGQEISITFTDGDTLGALATGDGQVWVYRNDEVVLNVSIGAWPYAEDGGYIGLGGYEGTILDDFGGGTRPIGWAPSGGRSGGKLALMTPKDTQPTIHKAALAVGEGWTVKKYYYAGGQRIAMRVNDTLYYLVTDHLGSTSKVITETGAVVSEMLYKPWGEVRYTSGTMPTDRTYTGQISEPDLGLSFFNAKWYDSYLNRFLPPDTDAHFPNLPG